LFSTNLLKGFEDVDYRIRENDKVGWFFSSPQPSPKERVIWRMSGALFGWFKNVLH